MVKKKGGREMNPADAFRCGGRAGVTRGLLLAAVASPATSEGRSLGKCCEPDGSHKPSLPTWSQGRGGGEWSGWGMWVTWGGRERIRWAMLCGLWPAVDGFRKTQRAKEIARNKKERQLQREALSHRCALGQCCPPQVS